MDARRAYETEVIATFARMGRAPQIADETVTSERQSYQFVRDHIQALKVAVGNYNANCSTLPSIDWSRIEDSIFDEVISEESAEERLSEARRGY